MLSAMNSFRSFIEMFQGSDETTSEVLWKVDNFSFCHLQKWQKIGSPIFNLGKGSDCFFELYPKGQTQGSVLDVHLMGHPYCRPKVVLFSIPGATGLETVMRKDDTAIASLTVKNNEQLRENPDMLTSGDTLTIRCVMTHPTKDDCKPRNILLQSRFDVRKFCFCYHLNNFNDKLNRGIRKQLPAMNIPNILKDAFNINLAFSPKKFEVQLAPLKVTQNNFLTCKLSVIDSEGVPLNLLKKGHLFIENKHEAWISSHPFNAAFSPDNEESILSKNTFILMIELTSTYQICSEEVRYGGKTLDSRDKNLSLISGCLKSDLQKLLEDAASCDVRLKIGSESVSVHKSILRARSSVFKAMMDHDLVENATNTVVIPDMEMESLQHMVKFMYTDTVKDLNWSSAVHLYYAADKYDIVLLKRRCAEYLVENMNHSNIYEVLVLCDMHDDDFLKKCARNFLYTQESALVNSEEWKTFENNYPNLALKMLRELYSYCKAVVPEE